MKDRLRDFIEEDKEFLGEMWQTNSNVLGNAKRLRDRLKTRPLIVTHPIGEEVLKTMDVLIEEQERKIEAIEERIDEYEEILDELG